MNENMYNNYEDDMEIDLVDLLFYLLKKWRSLIVAIVIGAILGAGLYMVKNHQQQAEQAEQEDAKQQSLPAVRRVAARIHLRQQAMSCLKS